MCAGQSERKTDRDMEKFCKATENYFTLPQKWNRYLIDEHGTLAAQWMDNGLVLLVSTIHH
eukprot:3403202-Ditylum_brightwellii.AAC.1